MKSIAKILVVALSGLALSGCVSVKMGSPQPSLQTLEALRASDFPAMAVGSFTLAPGLPASLDRSASIRAVSLSSPEDGSFAKYLGKVLETDLRLSGKLDPNADTVLSGLLTASSVDSESDKGRATLGAKFSLLRAGKRVFEKTLKVDATWDSTFIGAVAIPDAINNYTALYDKLALSLLTDADFKAAVMPAKPAEVPPAPSGTPAR